MMEIFFNSSDWESYKEREGIKMELSALNSLDLYGNTKASGIQNAQGSVDSNSPSQSLTMTDFYQLLATQLQYQDADNPMDTGDMMNQLVQTQMSQTIDKMTSAISDLATINMFSYASSMMGKEVTVAEVDEKGNYTGEETTGVVEGVSLGSEPTVTIDGSDYKLTQIMSVGTVSEDAQDFDPETQL